MYTLQALQIFIFLIPGFIAATTLDHLIIRNTKKELERIIDLLIKAIKQSKEVEIEQLPLELEVIDFLNDKSNLDTDKKKVEI